MDEPTALYRAEAARLLKAARWLLGSYKVEETRTGRETWKPTPLSAEELVTRSPLPENRFTANFIGRIERMEADVVPMHLRQIAQALGLGDDWFDPAIRLLSAAGHQPGAEEQIRRTGGQG